MAVAFDTKTEPSVFSLKTPLLARGRSIDMLAKSDLMAAHVKVYAEGGENGLHTHPNQDHIFVILAGEATFHLGVEERQQVVRKHEGIMLPAGAFYRFETSSDEPLVLLRVGASMPDTNQDRIKPDGSPIPGNSEDNKPRAGPAARKILRVGVRTRQRNFVLNLSSDSFVGRHARRKPVFW